MRRERSPWEQFDAFETPDGPVRWLKREVHDGRLLCCVADEAPGWHLSISHRDRKGQAKRWPTWSELLHAREELLDEELEFVMHFPAQDGTDPIHGTAFHLWQFPPRDQ